MIQAASSEKTLDQCVNDAMTWRKRQSEDALWMQCGDFSSKDEKVLLTIQRWRGAHRLEVQICLSHLKLSFDEDEEIPRRARFQLDAGEQSQCFVGGIGFVVGHEGLIYFTTGHGGYDKDLAVFKPVIDGITNRFGIVIDDKPINFMIDEDSRSCLAILFDVNEPPAELKPPGGRSAVPK